jgi:hypothetical protein
MTILRKRRPDRVPYGPAHKRQWRTLWRRCSCGLPAPCVDRLVPAPRLPFPPDRDDTPDHAPGPDDTRPHRASRGGSWTQPAVPDEARWPSHRTAFAHDPASPRTDPAGGRHAHTPRHDLAGVHGPAWPAGGATPRHRLEPAVSTRPSGFVRAVPAVTAGRAAVPPPRVAPPRVAPNGDVARPARATSRRAGYGDPDSHEIRDGPVSPPAATQAGRPGPSAATQASQPGPPAATQASRPGPSAATQASQPGPPAATQASRPGPSAATQAGRPGWLAPTVPLSQVGRAGDLTPAQAFRASRGRAW